MTKHIQDMTFSIELTNHVTGVEYQMVSLSNDDGHLVIEHPISISLLNMLAQRDEEDRAKALAAYLYIAGQYTRDYREGTGAASAMFARTALACLEQYVVESSLGEFVDEDFASLALTVYHVGFPVASVTSHNGSEIVITLRRQEGALWVDHNRYFTDEDTIPTIDELFDEWRKQDESRLQIEQAAVMTFGDVNFVYAVDASEAARVRREAVLQIIIGDRPVAEARIFENSKPLLFFVMEVFNMLALRFKVGITAGIGEEDRVVLLNAIAGLVGGHLGMGDHVRIEEGLMYAHEGVIDDQVTYVVSHELTSENIIKVSYKFSRMSDDTMRRSIEMVDNVDYLQTPMTPLEFYNAFQVDISRELGVSRRFEIAMITAMDSRNGIGKGNELLFHIKEDMRYFRETTINCPVIMGRKTFDSLPNPLVDRLNIVITTQPIKDHTTRSGVVFVNSKEEALAKAIAYLKESDGDQIWIIGGAQIYAMFLPDAAEIHVTTINAEREDADTFFPNMDYTAYEPTRLFEQDQVVTREGEDISYNRWILRRK
jgi:Dihydrofolate reductase